MTTRFMVSVDLVDIGKHFSIKIEAFDEFFHNSKSLVPDAGPCQHAESARDL